MAAPSLDTLSTPANGQILLLKRALSKVAVNDALGMAAARSSGNSVVRCVREPRIFQNSKVLCSLICFPTAGTPSFFPTSSLEEKTYSFLLLIETEITGKRFLGVFRHGIPTISVWTDERAVHLPRTKLTNAFSTGAAVSRLNLKRMTASKQELSGASYEGPDLQTSLPMMSAGRSAIRSLRFTLESRGSVTVSASTSRVQKSGGRCNLEELVALVRTVGELTLAAKPNAFLGTFAQAIPLSELPSGTVPNSILFDWSDLLDDAGFDLIRIRAGRPILPVDKRLLPRILGETVPVTAIPGGGNFSIKPGKVTGSFAATKTAYSLKNLLADQLYVHDVQTSERMTLAKWAREHDAYSVTFNQPEYFYGAGALYQRADFASEVNAVRQCLQPETALAGATSEKGNPGVQATSFPHDSIFGVAEDTIYAKRQWLCCADLGDEWADYLCIRDNALLFIHCKGSQQTVGASSYQEVIGQGLKNLGRARSTPAEFEAKIASLKKKPTWGKTKIKKLRGPGRKWTDFKRDIELILANPNSTREVHLVVTMLSKSEFDAEATSPAKPYFIQLIWILSSFINSCREMGAKPVIVCRT